MGDSAKIALVSDIHIGESDKPFFGIDVRKNFLSVWKEVTEWNPDLIVLMGDQALDRGERPAYEWLKKEIESVSVPIVQMIGNHDLAPVLGEVFGISHLLRNRQLYYGVSVRGYPLFFLDSGSNRVSPEQLEWLVREMKTIPGEALLFVHHPPVLCGAQFMDENWPLRNLSEVQETLRKIPNIRHIFSGHYHTSKVIDWEGKQIHIVPATQMQISEETEEFQVADYTPGWMQVKWDGVELQTEVRFVPLE